MSYQCLKTYTIDSGEYTITSFREQDLLLIKRWRNEQLHVLRQDKPLTDDDQIHYYHEAILPSMATATPRMILVSYLQYGKCIGYGGLTHINWEARCAEVSYLAETFRTADHSQYARDFEVFLDLLKCLAFDHANLNRIFTETYDIRPYHIAALEQSGFTPEGRLRQHIVINGNFTDVLYHGFLREDWHAR
jgi:RimJ/RimL family protein N-acetyltransferase